MFDSLCKIVIVALIVGDAAIAKLPDYFTKCKWMDATMADCISENVPLVMSHLREGIREIRFPPMFPFHLDEIDVSTSKDLTLKIKNIELYNLDQMKVKNLSYFEDSSQLSSLVSFDRLIFLSKYVIDGRVLVLPIQGHGALNMSLVDFNVEVQFTLGSEPRGSKDYLKVVEFHFRYDLGRVYLRLENLFNGDEILGAQVNEFLNENWREVNEILNPYIAEAIRKTILQIANDFSRSMPLSDLFIV